ncbi:MAG: hypothetical protein ACJ762_06275 [Solirubrobacteraceae bacterium]
MPPAPDAGPAWQATVEVRLGPGQTAALRARHDAVLAALAAARDPRVLAAAPALAAGPPGTAELTWILHAADAAAAEAGARQAYRAIRGPLGLDADAAAVTILVRQAPKGP